jgi:hypothetical protein
MMKAKALRLMQATAVMVGLLALPAGAQTMFKCVGSGGQVSYQQTPCPGAGPARSLERDRAEAESRHRDTRPVLPPRPAVAASAVPAGRPPATAAATATATASSSLPTAPSRWRCDGRLHCSKMTSCEEAKFFLANCPGVKMDGDHDGVPCEEQWCRSGW